MKIGVQLPEVEREVGWRELASMARAAEDAGFDSLWVGDHLLYRDPARGPWECWSLLAALAAITTRVEIGPLVACLGFHNPALLAKKAAAVDEISGGRLIFGIGAGWNRDEFDAFGYPFDHRVERFDEAFTIIRRLFGEGEVSCSGRYHHAERCALLPRPKRLPPFMIGSLGPRVLSATLPHVDVHHAWFAWFGNSPDGIPALRERIDAACEEAGRDPATLQRSVALYVQTPGGRGRPSGDPASREVAPIPLEALPAMLDAVAGEGIAHVQLVLDPITRESIEAAAGALGIDPGPTGG